jgi:hypothetical protein
MSREVSPSANRPYGIAAVSRLWRIARAWDVPSVYWSVGGTDPQLYAQAAEAGQLNQIPSNQFARVRAGHRPHPARRGRGDARRGGALADARRRAAVTKMIPDKTAGRRAGPERPRGLKHILSPTLHSGG